MADEESNDKAPDEEEMRQTKAFLRYRAILTETLASLVEICTMAGMQLDAKFISSTALALFELPDERKREFLKTLDGDIIPFLIDKGYITDNGDGTYSPTVTGKDVFASMEGAGNC